MDRRRRGALTEEDNLEEKVRDYEAKIAALERKVGQLTMETGRFKKSLAHAVRLQAREAVDRLRARGFTTSEGCQAVNLPRSSYYRGGRQLHTQAQAEFRAAVEAVCVEWPSYGYRRVTQELRRRGWHVNHKRVSRLMRDEALTAGG